MDRGLQHDLDRSYTRRSLDKSDELMQPRCLAYVRREVPEDAELVLGRRTRSPLH